MTVPVLHGYAEVYEAVAPRMTPEEADRHEPWQLGAVLGLHKPARDEPGRRPRRRGRGKVSEGRTSSTPVEPADVMDEILDLGDLAPTGEV